MNDKPRQYSDEEIQALLDTAEIDVPACPGRTYPCFAVRFYTDLENDEFPSLFKTYSHHPGKSDLHHEVAKKAFEVVLLGLS
ncbi:MAG: hypothetical protein ACXADB_03040 [Candidatus Hermodarchaeia archaeon]|jgi:hypothetical protein